MESNLPGGNATLPPDIWTAPKLGPNHDCDHDQYHLYIMIIIVSTICMIMQSCKMSNLLHGANLPNQILPQEKRTNRDKFST